MPALLGGEVALSFATVVSSLPHVKTGKLRALGVTSAKRTPAAPEFPTVAESGLPGYEAVAWYGVLAPASTPREIVVRLNGEIVRALKLPEVQQLLLAQGAEPVSDTPEQFAAILKADVAKWGDVVREGVEFALDASLGHGTKDRARSGVSQVSFLTTAGTPVAVVCVVR